MKHQKWIYSLTAVLVIAGALMKILHLPYGNIILQAGIYSTIFYQAWYVTQLEKRIKELESQDS